ncbi:MAG TPA: GDP-mannose 4,6-dehydratase [Terriglobales bacterium]|nr:GDP-mannose 4,6-dehydratase [Terriglobales bacterium]
MAGKGSVMKDKVLPFHSVLIFGGAGFIGSNWAYRLLRTTDVRVHIFDNLSRRGVRHNLRWLQKAFDGSERLQVTIGDVRDAAAVQRAVQKATEIYHFAAQVAVTNSVEDPRFDFEVNVGGTFNVLEAARSSGRHPFVLFTSTNKVYGNMASQAIVSSRSRYSYLGRDGVSEAQPLDFHSPYGCSKGAADQYVHDYARMFDLPTVVFRMSCIAGPRQFGNEDQGWVAHFLYSALQDQPVTIYGDGRQVRDVLAVEDLMRAFQAVRDNLNRTAGQVYNVGGGLQNTVSLLEIMEKIEKLTGHRLQHEFEGVRPGDQPVYVTDFSKLLRDTDWSPQLKVEQILTNIFEWRRQNRELFRPVAVESRIPLADLAHVPEAAS